MATRACAKSGSSSSSSCSGSDAVPSDEEREHLPAKRRKVLPYACDPSATSDSNETPTEPAAESSPDALPRSDRRRLLNTRWCCCESRCGTMSTPVESVCCKEQCKVKEKAGSLPCITAHRLFELYCLDRDILDLEYKKLRVCRPLSTRNIKEINAKYRYTAYCQFVWWIHGRLGKENRVTLPSCVVTRVRKEFPAPNPADYTGFKQSKC
ncbi:P2X purinoceptor 7-like [Ixodes scapularis]|uniref:P2X purinoceptor 7 n=1 Tax=Ixodes scapularis TaxID=6945 RepID=UPI001A9FBD7C|nr:P2X purinoceptor 7 [Ixodes scapularis]XP_042143525.1 P2X purinoceptor 7-like [Ixodes scapularis]